jgi:methyl-accepting chemotaxis protein
MSLQMRILLPIIVLAIVGLGAALLISYQATTLYAQSRAHQTASAEQSAAVKDIVRQIDIADAELNRVLEMVTLFDTDTGWVKLEAAVNAIHADGNRIMELPHSDATTAVHDRLDATVAAFLKDAALLFGQTKGGEIPTRESITRLRSEISGIGDELLGQVTQDAAGFGEQASDAFNAALRELIIGVMVAMALVIAVAVLMMRRTSRQIATVAADLARVAGGGTGLDGMVRDEVANLQAASRAFGRRAAALASFQAQLSQAVDAAVAGNFAHRLQIDAPEADLQQIAAQMNQLLSGVEAALSEASGVLMRIAKGDMSARITGSYQGVLLELKRDTNATGEQLYRIVTEIDGATRTINGNMKQILTGANSLSDRTRQQVDKLEDLASSMASLTQTAREASDSVARARVVSDEATARANEGDRVAEEATRAIMAIQNSSEKINEVTIVVEGLAFQTSILAINAAVEAARAGETGKGFAIVAQEVRTLAERSAEAAKMIAAQTAESVAQIRIGAERVRATREVLGRIKTGILGLQEAMQSVEGVSRTQLQRFLNLADTISHLDKETQLNASMARDSVVAASDVDAQANRLQEQMAVFHLGQTGGQHRFAAE